MVMQYQIQGLHKSPCGRPKKIRIFKGTAKKFDLNENINVNVASYPKVQNVFFNAIQPLRLNNINYGVVTSPKTVESLQKMKFEINIDINSKISLCQGDITKINVDAIVKATSETLISEGSIDGVIHEVKGPGIVT